MGMSRRSWFSSVFGGNEETGYFFGLQLLIRAFGEDALRARLAEVFNAPEAQTEDVAEKRRYIKRVVAILLEQQAFWSQTFWDYKTKAEEADAEFEAWAAEISASTATEHEEIDLSIDASQRLSHDKDYVAVTIIFRLSAHYPPAEIEDEAKFWESTTIERLVRGLLLINPETILADGIFIIPGTSDDGLSEEDLLTGGWSYLRVIN